MLEGQEGLSLGYRYDRASLITTYIAYGGRGSLFLCDAAGRAARGGIRIHLHTVPPGTRVPS